MKKIGAAIESLILFAIGVYVGILVLFGEYWRFLNPKFKWLTVATAIALMFTGALTLFHPSRRFRLSRILVFLLFLRLLTMGMSGSVSFVKALQAGLSGKTMADNRPSILVNGREYIKINLVEPYLLCKKKDPAKLDKSYVVQGIVRRSQVLDGQGQFAMVRTAVFCCLADAVSMGFRIHDLKQDPGRGPMDEFTDGIWVELFGKLEPFAHEPPEPHLHTQGLFLPVLSDSYGLVADKIISIQEPHIPYLFEFRSHQPYAF
jgi:hypothetical protein